MYDCGDHGTVEFPGIFHGEGEGCGQFLPKYMVELSAHNSQEMVLNINFNNYNYYNYKLYDETKDIHILNRNNNLIIDNLENMVKL